MRTLILSTGKIIIVVILAFVILFVSFVATDLIPNAILSTTVWAFVYSLMTFIVVYLLQVKLDKDCMKTIGSDFSQSLIRPITCGLGIGAATFSLILITELAFGFIRPLSFFGDWEIPSHCIGLMIQGLILCLGIAIGEEVLYRGYLYGYLKKEYGLLVGIILSSIVFSAVHAPDGNRTLLQLGNIVAIGILLALISAYYKNIWAPVGFHWIWNLLEMYIFPVSANSSEKGVLRFIPVSGQGIVGPENDILTTVVIIVVSTVFVIKILDEKVLEHTPLIKKGGFSIILIWILAFTGIIGIPKLLEETPYEIVTISADELYLEEFKLSTNIAPSSNMASNQVMAPIAWTKSTGRDVTILQTIVANAADQISFFSHEATCTILKEIAPDARLETLTIDSELKSLDGFMLLEAAASLEANIVIIYQPLSLNRTILLTTVKALINRGHTVIIRRDASLVKDAGDLFKELSREGVLCVGDISPEGLIPDPIGTRSLADIYAPYGTDDPYTSLLVSAGVVALVIEAAGHQGLPYEIKDGLIKSGIKHYQVYDTITKETHEDLYQVSFQWVFHPVASFLKRPLEYITLNAPRAVGIAITSDWTLTALNIPSAWEISSGKGVKVAVLGSGFQLEIPELQDHLGEGVCFHDKGYRNYPSYQGTILAEIVCSIAPNAIILPILIDDSNPPRVKAAIDWAVQKEADIILMSMHHEMNTQEIYSSIDHAVNKGKIVIWNSYEGKNNGVLKSGYIGETEHALSGLYVESSMIPTTYLGKRSYAAAQLAGIAALIREVESDFTAQELRELLAQTASQTGNQYFPNVGRAIESLLNK